MEVSDIPVVLHVLFVSFSSPFSNNVAFFGVDLDGEKIMPVVCLLGLSGDD